MVDPEISHAAYKAQVEQLVSLDAYIRKYEWIIEGVEPDLFVQMHPHKHPEILFLVRLRCNDYPARAPSLQFVEPSSRNEGKQYWPQQGSAFQASLGRGPSPQLCIPGIREYHEGCHSSPSDQNPWNPEKYTFANIIERVQLLLNEAYP